MLVVGKIHKLKNDWETFWGHAYASFLIWLSSVTFLILTLYVKILFIFCAYLLGNGDGVRFFAWFYIYEKLKRENKRPIMD